MRVQTNERLIKRETRIGFALLGVTFALLIVGWIGTSGRVGEVDLLARFGEEQPWVPIAAAYVTVLIGLGFYYLGQGRLKRYGPKYRQDGLLRQLLKGLDDRHVLYVFPSSSLPDYVLAGPFGVVALVTRDQNGQVICQNDRWQQLRGRGAPGAMRALYGSLYGSRVGNPSLDATAARQKLEQFLAARLDDASAIPITPIVVFTNPAARLRVERASCTVTMARELRGVLRKLKTPVSPGQLDAVQQALGTA
ncbi:MAG: hypothetical protein IT307_09230 [Chloroflexi bacterium]|nr:hypothetical protein [Chloroflexota bacterium]